MNMPGPRPWDFHEAARFRLPGFGGAALFLRSQIQSAHASGTIEPQLAFDIMLLSPELHTWYLSRVAGPGFVERMAGFLFASANDFHPELSVPALEDGTLGLVLTVVSSTDDRVGLEVTVVDDLEATVPDFDGINFETSRATLAACAHAVRVLDGSWPDDNDIDEELGS